MREIRMPWFDVAGVGNAITGAGLRPIAKAVELPPDPTVGAPALDPTEWRTEVSRKAPPPTRQRRRRGTAAIRTRRSEGGPCR